MATKELFTWIMECAAQITRLPVHELYKGNRQRHVSMVRRAACTVAIEHGFGYAEIGRLLGGMDHSTICYYVDQAKIAEQESKAFRHLMASIRKGVAEGPPAPRLKVVPKEVVDRNMRKPEPRVEPPCMYDVITNSRIERGSIQLARAVRREGGHR